MSCKCKDDFETGPLDSCLICAEKHFTAAMQAMAEFGYKDKRKNRSFAIGEIGLAINHIQVEHPDIAGKMRIVRHHIQYRQENLIGGKWDEICTDLYNAITAELASVPASKPVMRNAAPAAAGKSDSIGKIYIFSNVQYPEKNKITPDPEDLLIFLNKATTIGYYADHKRKIVYHRSPKEDYGRRIDGIRNFYVFNGGPVSGIPRDFIKELKTKYDWDYEIEPGKVKCMTTGYMVVKWIEHKYPDRELVLVNFGYEVQKSTYRCPWHNWKFEADDLAKMSHIFLEDKAE